MRARPFLAPLVAVLLGSTSGIAVAQDKPLLCDQQSDRTVLPPPECPFKGKIETAMKNSTQDWPQPLKAPEGAPNVLMILGDDIGFGTPSVVIPTLVSHARLY